MNRVQRARVLNKKQIALLFDHILDGFRASHEGAGFIHKEGIISDQEYHDLLQKNSIRLIERVREFRIANNVLGLVFAFIFTWHQVSGEDLEMRRARRTRTRRRNETEQSIS